MALNLGDPTALFEGIREHVGHEIACVVYGDPPANVAIECETCNAVLLNQDAPDDALHITGTDVIWNEDDVDTAAGTGYPAGWVAHAVLSDGTYSWPSGATPHADKNDALAEAEHIVWKGSGPIIAPRTPSYRIRFVPQAWISDYAIEVDPQGPTEWVASPAYTREMLETHGEKCLTPGYEADEWKQDPGAPEWIRQWGGPFECYAGEVCPEHPIVNCGDAPHEQCHSPEDHVDASGNPAPDQCRCTTYQED